MKDPRVLVVTRRTTRKNKYIDYVGEYHLELLIRLRMFPVMVPVVEGTLRCLPQYMQGMKGLLLVEGEDIEPRRFKARPANFRYLEKTHPLKDEIEIRLIRHALRRRLPILGICRGSQLVNVVCGGTLYGDVQKEKKSTLKHIDYHHYDTYRHPITILPEHSSRKVVWRARNPREQLPSSGYSRVGSSVQADGLCRRWTGGGLLRSKGDFSGWASISSRAYAPRILRQPPRLESFR